MQNHFPSDITSPTHFFKNVRYIISPDKGTLSIRKKSGRVFEDVEGTVSATETGWQLTNDQGTWTVLRKKGCGCGVQSQMIELEQA